MALDQHTVNLINLTARAFNGDVTSVSPTDGLSLIDSWISFFQSSDQANGPIAQGLNELRAELQSGNLNGSYIQSILSDLSQQTEQITGSADANDQPDLSVLSKALQSFTHQINGESGPAKTGGQAPMTSTVGGDSTNSGPGTSGFDPNDDELSNRNGGTIDNGPTVYMDDTTGSNGA